MMIGDNDEMARVQGECLVSIAIFNCDCVDVLV
jgi:hypothetical protein